MYPQDGTRVGELSSVDHGRSRLSSFVGRGYAAPSVRSRDFADLRVRFDCGYEVPSPHALHLLSLGGIDERAFLSRTSIISTAFPAMSTHIASRIYALTSTPVVKQTFIVDLHAVDSDRRTTQMSILLDS